MKTDFLSTLILRGQEHDKRLREVTRSEAGSAQWVELLDELRAWLAECVRHGRYVPEGSADRRALQGHVDYWTSRLQQAGHPLPEFELLDSFDPKAGVPLGSDDFPYYGLLAATEEGAQRFFGRDEQIVEYVAHLESHAALLIQSESGGGKSSVAMAGVIPKLRERHPDWLIAPRLAPGAHPSVELGEALAAALGDGLAKNDALATLAALGPRTLLLFIDQLEELLTVCTDESDQEGFCRLLAALADSGRVHLLATMRSDHYDRLANSQACRPLFLTLTAANSVKMLPPMSFEQIRSVILKPAQAVGLRYVPASLVDRLANETANLAGGLPRLQFALQRLWDLRSTNESGVLLDVINEASFAKLPNVREALGAVAQSAFESLSEQEQRACERLMLELTVLDDQLEVPLRRRRFERELIAVLVGAKLADPNQALALIQQFDAKRLLVRTGAGETRQLEVAHESLFRYWPQFQAWINNDKARSRLKDVRQIARDALQWEHHGRSPDYLMLKGEPLEHARRYCDENWLDSASQRYCSACDEAVHTQQQLELTRERQRLAAEDEALRVRKAAEAAASQAKAEAEQRRRSRNGWLRVAGGSGIALALAGLVYSHELEKGRVANRVALASLIALLDDPLEALDLAYTFENNSSGNFVAPLAHALDRLAGSEVVAARDAGADFSPSGRALVQLVRDGSKVTVRIVPIEPDGSHWPTPAMIDIAEGGEKDGSLAALDVGPPIAAPNGTRLVVMSFIGPPVPGKASATFRKLVAYTISRDGAASVATKWPIDFPFPPSTSQVSDVAFDATGAGAAVASVQYLGGDAPPKGEVILLRTPPLPGTTTQKGAGPVSADSQRLDNREVVTALAYAERPASAAAGGTALITGRLDGSIFCGETSDTRIEGPDRSPVTRLRVAGARPSWYVALHASNKLVVGKCGGTDSAQHVLDERLVTPQSLIFRSVGDVGEMAEAGTAPAPAKPGLQLSFTADRALCRITWADSNWPDPKTDRKCTTGLGIDQAVPMFSVSGKGVGNFLTLPDRSRPWVVLLNGGLPGSGNEVSEVKGVPVGLPPDASSRRPGDASPSIGSLAASPSQAHQARITVEHGVEKDSARVERLQANGKADLVAGGGNRPIAISVNDRGVLAVLEEGRSLAVVQPGSAQANRNRLDFDATCLKLTPDGQHALVAGRGGEAALVDLNAALGAAVAPEAKKMQAVGLGAPLTACAVGNDRATVSGFSDGKVIYAPVNGKPTELSRRVQFHLPSEVMDVSIDTSGKFVAVLGKRAVGKCVAGTSGYPVRIWDLTQALITFPVAVGCLPNANVIAIGPVRLSAGQWVLPVYAESGGSTQRFDYPCLGCSTAVRSAGPTGASAPDAGLPSRTSLVELTRKNFKPKLLSTKEIQDAYGIEP